MPNSRLDCSTSYQPELLVQRVYVAIILNGVSRSEPHGWDGLCGTVQQKKTTRSACEPMIEPNGEPKLSFWRTECAECVCVRVCYTKFTSLST